MTPPAITIHLEFPDGRRAEVGMVMVCEPLLPTPNERGIYRAPLVNEYAEIIARLTRLDSVRLEVVE